MFIALGAAALLAVAVIVLYNGLVSGRNQVKNAWSQIDVQLKRRYDLIPNLVETVRDSMAYEQETLRQVVEARNKAVAASGPAEAAAAASGVTAALGRLFAVMEAYPELKAQGNVASLMEELTATENKVAFARQHYQDSVMSQNNRVQGFPGLLLAGALGFKEEVFFELPEAEAAAVREAPKVKLR